MVWFYVSESGRVLYAQVCESSGQADLDEAALGVAAVYQFTPALDPNDPVAVWIQLPVTFSTAALTPRNTAARPAPRN